MTSIDSPTLGVLRHAAPVIVTGGEGYVGSAIRECLRQHGVDVRSFDSRSAVGSERVDLRDAVAVKRALADLRPMFVIHCATASAVAYAQRFLESTQNDVSILAAVLQNVPPECRVVYCSSSYVYSGAAAEGMLSEECALKPVHNFGIAKLFFEQLLQRTHPNSVIFRLCSIFGGGAASFPNTIHDFVREARQHQTITVWGEGRRKIQYVYLADVVRAILAGIWLGAGIYNVGGADYVSVADTASLVSSMMHVNVARMVDRPEGETLPPLDTTRLQQASGLAFTPLRQAIGEYVGLSEVSA